MINQSSPFVVGNCILFTSLRLAILIACLGLFGLATFTAEQRTKEMGIRKVVGASVSKIFILLTTEVVKWVLIANLIALPLAYYFMQQWLEGFAYPVKMSWLTFVGALVIGIGFFKGLCVGYNKGSGCRGLKG